MEKGIIEESLFILFWAFVASFLHPFIFVVFFQYAPNLAYNEWLDNFVYSSNALVIWINLFMIWIAIFCSFLLLLVVLAKIRDAIRKSLINR